MPEISFGIAMIIWSAVTTLIATITAIAVFFAKSWKVRIDKDYKSLADMFHADTTAKNINIEKLREEHGDCKFHVVETYVDKITFQHQVNHCVAIQNKIFDKVDELTKEFMNFKTEVIKEIRNGNGNKKH